MKKLKLLNILIIFLIFNFSYSTNFRYFSLLKKELKNPKFIKKAALLSTTAGILYYKHTKDIQNLKKSHTKDIQNLKNPLTLEEVEERDNAYALFNAIETESRESIKYWLENGANPNAQKYGKTLLMHAISRNGYHFPNFDIIELFSEYDCDTDIKDDQGCNIIDYIIHEVALGVENVCNEKRITELKDLRSRWYHTFPKLTGQHGAKKRYPDYYNPFIECEMPKNCVYGCLS